MASNKWKSGHEVRELTTIANEQFKVPRSKFLKLALYEWFNNENEIYTLVRIRGCHHVWVISLSTMEALIDCSEVNLHEDLTMVEYDEKLQSEAERNDLNSVIRSEIIMGMWHLYNDRK